MILQTHILEDIDEEFNTVKKIVNSDSNNFLRSLLLVWLKHNDVGRDPAGFSYNLFTLGTSCSRDYICLCTCNL